MELTVEQSEDRIVVVGKGGSLELRSDDEIAWKLFMLIEGECSSRTRIATAGKYGFSRQRYCQIRTAFRERGAEGLASRKRGPKTNYRRDGDTKRQIVRHRYLDPDASAEVVGQKLRQDGIQISDRTVYRVFKEYGLQKKGSTKTGQNPTRTRTN